MMLALMPRRFLVLLLAGSAWLWAMPGARAQADPYTGLDRVLDVYVRDGLVYYQALKSERATLDRFVASLDDDADRVARMSEADRRAYWVNAYNALVLRTVINAYPIRGKEGEYPAVSVAQIPGGFDRVKHRVAGQVLSLDEIEKSVIAGFGDARLLFALGRGTLGSGRLRSEVYRGATLDVQLGEALREWVTRSNTLRIDRAASVVEVSPLFSWREAQFVQSFSTGGEMWSNRSPLERAIMIMSYPHLFPSEREFLALNTFRVQFGAYDWRLNDLTGGAPR